MLEQDKGRNRRKKRADADQNSRHNLERSMSGRLQKKKRYAGDDESQLGHHADRGIDDHAGRRLRARHAA